MSLRINQRLYRLPYVTAIMEIPGSTLITVRSSINSPNETDEIFSQCHSQTREFRAVTPTGTIFANPSAVQPAQIANGNRTRSLESQMLEEIKEVGMEGGTESDSSQDKESHEIVVVNSPAHLPGSASRDQSNCCGQSHGLHSVSTTVVGYEEARVESFEDEISFALEWFRSTFNKIGKNGRITLADFKHAATECDVRTYGYLA